MFRFYETTQLEGFVENLFIKHGMCNPKQLTIDEISTRLNIWVHYDRVSSRAIETVPGRYSIFLDSRLSIEQQWLDFLHELCHLLRHAGNQMVLLEQFTRAQETEAEHFVLYAAMPFFMLSQLRLPVRKNDAIQFLASIFKVPLYLAKKRLEQIQRREYQGKLLMEAARQLEYSEPVNKGAHVVMRETKVYAFYDPTGDFESPSQLIVNVDQQTLLTQEELIFSTDGPFEQVEESQLKAFIDCKPVKFNDLDYRDGKISLKLNHLASRYYNSAYKFVIQKKVIEEVMMFHGAYF